MQYMRWGPLEWVLIQNSIVDKFNRVHSIDNFMLLMVHLCPLHLVLIHHHYMAFTARACEHAVSRLKKRC